MNLIKRSVTGSLVQNCQLCNIAYAHTLVSFVLRKPYCCEECSSLSLSFYSSMVLSTQNNRVIHSSVSKPNNNRHTDFLDSKFGIHFWFQIHGLKQIGYQVRADVVSKYQHPGHVTTTGHSVIVVVNDTMYILWPPRE